MSGNFRDSKKIVGLNVARKDTIVRMLFIIFLDKERKNEKKNF